MHASGAFGHEPGPPSKRGRFAGAARSGAATRQSIMPTVRTLVLQTHRWTGLTVGLVLAALVVYFFTFSIVSAMRYSSSGRLIVTVLGYATPLKVW